jgi:hypothetical protein
VCFVFRDGYLFVNLTTGESQVAEEAVRLFINNDKCTVAGLILAGSADFKTELSLSDLFDQVHLLELVPLYFIFLFFSDATVVGPAFASKDYQDCGRVVRW